nr:MAG TPA: hypothetical protein [Caudoviricetes sp.]
MKIPAGAGRIFIYFLALQYHIEFGLNTLQDLHRKMFLLSFLLSSICQFFLK